MTLIPDPADKIIVALDGMHETEVIELVQQIPKLSWIKIGLELFVSGGPQLVNNLRNMGKQVFLDLKFHDIPTTMSKACRQAAMTGARLITVHACSGSKALFEANQAALEGAAEVGFPPPTLLAVTVLTSWSNDDFSNELLIAQSINERVRLLTDLAVASGLGGCVCSPLEAKELRSLNPSPFEIITPGIRLKGGERQDQSRVMAPLEAFQAGASKLVVGRSITQSENPSEAFDSFCRELTIA